MSDDTLSYSFDNFTDESPGDDSFQWGMIRWWFILVMNRLVIHPSNGNEWSHGETSCVLVVQARTAFVEWNKKSHYIQISLNLEPCQRNISAFPPSPRKWYKVRQARLLLEFGTVGEIHMSPRHVNKMKWFAAVMAWPPFTTTQRQCVWCFEVSVEQTTFVFDLQLRVCIKKLHIDCLTLIFLIVDLQFASWESLKRIANNVAGMI